MNIPTIYPVACHTDHVGAGTTFVAIKGDRLNGADYILAALEKGATHIVVHQDQELSSQVLHAITAAGCKLTHVADTRLALAQLSAQALNHPARQLKIIGVTGTKGKTSTTYLLEHILKTAGYKTALMTTVKNSIMGTDFSTNLTTQQPDYIHVFLDQCVQAGVEYVVMEVAAQALTLHRVAGIQFDGIVFTNFSHEHLEFYPDLETYFAAKCELFALRKPGAPTIINGDDEYVGALRTRFDGCSTVSTRDPYAHYFARIQHEVTQHVAGEIVSGGHTVAFECPALFGAFNAYNILAAASMALALSCKPQAVSKALKTFSGVPGRLERYYMPNGAQCIIDYAHNPESYRQLLGALRPMTNKLIVVFGAGGNRDKSKRPLMGSIAAHIADEVIITSDNPRFEKPEDILADIVAGIAEAEGPKLTCELDREKAIRMAYERSGTGAFVVILGKGPDEYQMIGDVKHPFSEKGIIKTLGAR